MNEYIIEVILHYLSGNATDEEVNTLEDWIKETENRDLFEEIKIAWLEYNSDSLDSKKGEQELWKRIVHKTEDLKEFYSAERRKRVLFVLNRVAIVFVISGLSALISFLVFSQNESFLSSRKETPSHIVYNDTIVIETPKGFRSEVSLPDGSIVWLNSDSYLKYTAEFHQGERTVFLDGEGYFDVVKMKTVSPFYIRTKDVRIRVIGTEFNVKSYADYEVVEATLKEGELEVEILSENQVSESFKLNPNEKAIIRGENGPHSHQIIVQKNVNTALYTSWKDGHLIFKDENFKTIIDGMERWYGVEIEILNSELEDLVFTANFRNETVEQALKAIRYANDFEYDYDIKNNLITIK